MVCLGEKGMFRGKSVFLGGAGCVRVCLGMFGCIWGEKRVC